MAILVSNKKISINYNIVNTYEAGIVLNGNEVKSLVKSEASIDESFVIFSNRGEAYILNMYISPFKNSFFKSINPNRKRKLLLNKHELIRIQYLSKKEKLAIIPTKLYFKNKKIKVEIALAKSKNKSDKRESIKKRDINREIKKYI